MTVSARCLALAAIAVASAGVGSVADAGAPVHPGKAAIQHHAVVPRPELTIKPTTQPTCGPPVNTPNIIERFFHLQPDLLHCPV